MADVFLIGTGRMARAYVPVLRAHNMHVIAVGRSEGGSRKFQEETSVETTPGGIAAWCKKGVPIPQYAIVAIDDAEAPRVAQELINVGCKAILLEKPGALTKQELVAIEKKAQAFKSNVFIGYNRRFLASVQRAKEMIAEDGGATSVYFEFNERRTQPERIANMHIPERTVEKWFIANSTHVVDLALYLADEVRELTGFTASGPLWAPQSHPTLFAGAGMIKSGIPFSYYANWEIDGPWLVEIGTAERKLILNPLEKLTIEGEGPIEIPDVAIDTTYRPGLYREVESFLGSKVGLKTLDEQINHFAWY